MRIAVMLLLLLLCFAAPAKNAAAQSITIELTLEVEVFEPNQFRKLVDETLASFAEETGIKKIYSEPAVELLMLTAAQESHLGRYLEQIKGPAIGIFQIEPRTLGDLYLNFLKHRPFLLNALHGYCGPKMALNSSLKSNLAYQILVARLIYYRVPDPLPNGDDLEEVAKFYKEHFNTVAGKATVEEAINNYKRYVLEEKI